MSQLPEIPEPSPNHRLALDIDGEGPSPAAGYPRGISVSEGRHLLDYVKVLYKRRWSVITAFVVVFLGVVVYTFTVTPIYEAKAKLLIESEDPNVVSFKEVIEGGEARNDYYQTQYNLLQSRSLARRTLDSLKLWNDPEFAAPKSDWISWTKRAIVNVVTFGSSSNASKGANETPGESRAIDTLLSNLAITPVRNSRIVDLKYRSPNRERSAEVVNAQARNYIEQSMEYKFLASKEAGDWLAQRLTEQRKKVEDSEAALQRYREDNDAISLEDRQNIVVQKLGDLNAAVTKAKTERIEKEALYNQLKSIQTDRAALDTFPAILSNSFIQQQKSELAALQREQAQMAEKLGERHPEMLKLRSAIQNSEAKLQGEIGKVVQSVRNEFLSAQAQEQSLVTALEQQKREALGLNRKGIEYRVLERDVESNKQIYESLLQRAKETGVSGELKSSNIRIVDVAERPNVPATPNKTLNVLLGLLGGGALGIALAFFFEYVDNRIKTPEEIRSYLGIPFIGLIPLVSGFEKRSNLLINNAVPAGFIEALRNVRTNVLFSSAEGSIRSLAITSTGPGEGKTLVASNLAIALAQAGQRVLLIDGDMRCPRVHEEFGISAEPGLSNLMVGNAKASEAVRKSRVPGLWLLPAGRIPPNPSELLGSQRFRDFLGTLREHFDWLLIDTPPVMPVTDAAVIVHVIPAVLFVVGAEMPSRYAAQRALEQLQVSRPQFVGAVLNRVDLERNAYYYSQYYKKSYGHYYTRQPAAQSAVPAPNRPS